jgi:succinoglycan biosynthesis transport protein ExoP
MSFSQFLLILRARKKIVLWTLFIAVLLTLVVSLLMPKSFKATSSLVMNYKGVDSVTGLAMPGQLLPGYMATQIDIIGSKSVALRVVDQLGLANNAAVIEQFKEATDGQGTVRDWLADLLLKKLEIEPSRESSVVNISFSGSDPAFVAAVANAFADAYQKTSIQLKVEPMQRASTYFNDQIRLLRDNLEVSQSRLSKYQQEHGIVSVDNRLDVESNRLNDLSMQLVAAQAQSADAQSRRSMAQSAAGAQSPDVVANPLIQNLKVNLGAAEARLAQLGQRLARNHPEYLAARAEVDKLSADLREQLRVATNSVSNNATIQVQREATLREAVAAQKTKLLELNRLRDEMNVLQKDVESAQHAFDATSQRSSQTRIEGSANQSDVAVLNPAVAPTQPSSPRVLLNVLLSIVFGIILGVGLSLAREMLDRRVRSKNDLTEVLQLPVLGTLDWKQQPQKRRSLFKGARTPRALTAN